MASGGSHTVATSAGNSVSFDFAGTGFVLYRKMDSKGGYASVTVDGKDFWEVAFFLREARWQVPAVIDLHGVELVQGKHTIVLKVSNENPKGSGGNNVYLDALEMSIPATIRVSDVFGTVETQSLMQSDAVKRVKQAMGLSALFI